MFWEVSHSADKALKVETHSLEQLFYESALGLNFLYGNSLPQSNKVFNFKYENNAFDYETLLIDFLNYLIYMREKGFYFISCSIKLNYLNLKAMNYFKKYNKNNYLVKSATFHNLNIFKSNHLYECTIVFDV